MKGEGIKEMRESLGLTREEFAQVFGSHTTTIYRWETSASEIGKDAMRFLSALKEILKRPGVAATTLGDDIKSALNMHGPLKAIHVILGHYFNTNGK